MHRIRVTVWGENVHERRDASVRDRYPQAMQATIAQALVSCLVAAGGRRSQCRGAAGHRQLSAAPRPTLRSAVVLGATRAGVWSQDMQDSVPGVGAWILARHLLTGRCSLRGAGIPRCRRW